MNPNKAKNKEKKNKEIINSLHSQHFNLVLKHFALHGRVSGEEGGGKDQGRQENIP